METPLSNQTFSMTQVPPEPQAISFSESSVCMGGGGFSWNSRKSRMVLYADRKWDNDKPTAAGLILGHSGDTLRGASLSLEVRA